MILKRLNIALLMLLIFSLIILYYEYAMYNILKERERLKDLQEVLLHLKEDDEFLKEKVVKKVYAQCVKDEILEGK